MKKLIVVKEQIPNFLLRPPRQPVSRILETVERMGYIPGPELKTGARLPQENYDIRVALYRSLGRLGGGVEDGEAVKQIGPPNQLQYLASMLIREGYQVRIFDQLAEPYSPEQPQRYPSTKSDGQMQAEIVEWRPNVLMAGSFTCQFRRGLKIAGDVKETLGIPVVWGGYHVTDVAHQYRIGRELEGQKPDAGRILKADMRTVFQRGIVDYACVGEGITTILDILEILKGNRDPEQVAGIVFIKDGSVVATPRRERESIDNYPLLHWGQEYDPWMYYAHGRDYPVVLMTTSQGCRYTCKFCSVPSTYPEGVRSASTIRALAELRNMHQRIGPVWPRSKIMVNLTDEDWMSDPPRIIDFCNAVCETELGKHFEFNSFGTLLDAAHRGKSMLEAMARAGWSYFFYGLESTIAAAASDWRRPDRKVRDRLAMAQQAIDNTAQVGIMPFLDFIAGHPDHTMEQTREDYERLMTLRRVPYAYMPILAPMPGTELYWEVLWGMRGEGFLPGVTYDELDANHPVLALRDGGNVKELRKRMVQEFFTRPQYLEDANRMIDRHPHTGRFFAKNFAKIARDYPENAELQRLAKRYTGLG